MKLEKEVGEEAVALGLDGVEARAQADGRTVV